MKLGSAAFLMALGLIALGPPTGATPLYGVAGNSVSQAALAPLTPQAQHGKQIAGNGGVFQQQLSLGLTTTPVALHVGALNATSTVVGNITNGFEHGSASVTAPSVVYCVGSSCTTDSFAQGSSSQSWLDTLYIHGAPNTEVQFDVTYHFDGQVSGGGLVAGTQATSGLEIFGDGSISDSVGCAIYCPGGVFNRQHKITSGTFNFGESFVLSALSGSVLSALESMDVQAIAGDQFGTGQATSDALNTGYFTIQVLTPGASITTASGLSYQPVAVPEPATLALLGLGLAGLGFSRRGRVN